MLRHIREKQDINFGFTNERKSPYTNFASKMPDSGEARVMFSFCSESQEKGK